MVAQSPSSWPKIDIQTQNGELMAAVTKMYAERSQEILARLEKMEPAVRKIMEKAIVWAYTNSQSNNKKVYAPIIVI